MRPHAAWNVITQLARAGGPTRSTSRSRISPAALFVNVIARISGGFTPTAFRRCAMRRVSTRVLPEPAPAITSTGPSVARTASRWAGLRSWRYVSGVVAAISPPYRGKRTRGQGGVPFANLCGEQSPPDPLTSFRMRAGRGRDPQMDMSAEDVSAILDRLEGAGLTVWIDGGWAIDAVAARETRRHDDLDL